MSGVFSRLLNSECKSIILDGELMGWHKERRSFDSKGMSFDVKKLSENSHHQPCFVAFDIIMYNDTLLDNEPYAKRLEILKDAFKEEEGCLMLCKSTKISNRYNQLLLAIIKQHFTFIIYNSVSLKVRNYVKYLMKVFKTKKKGLY